MKRRRPLRRSLRITSFAAAIACLFIGVVAVADFINGGFESGNLTGWTVTWYTRGTNTLANPVETTLRSQLSLTNGGTDVTAIVSGSAPQTEYDVNLEESSTLRFPLYGLNSARVNYTLPDSTNANSLTQTKTITTEDVDTYDDKAHVRFAVAPVLENGSHSATEQPYYFVGVRNITKNTNLYNSFRYAMQPGVPWKAGPPDWVYTDWQLVDVSPGAGALDVGDQIEVEIIAARCLPSGHSGYVYVDGFGSFLPGLSIVATGPQAANDNTDITYTYLYRNGASTAVTNATATIVVPGDTTFVSVNVPGVTCSTPAVGATGTVTCNLGTLPQNAVGNFEMTVHIDDDLTDPVGHGNYSIAADQSTALLGPLVRTNTTTGITYADLGVTITNGVPALEWGSSTQYTLTVSNNGPSAVTGATVSYTPPAELSSVTWTCTSTAGSTCPSSGSGSVSELVNLSVDGTAIFIINGTVVSGSGTQLVTHTATISTPMGVTDNSPDNNTAVDKESLGLRSSVTVTKNTDIGGTVASAPAGINCGLSCLSQSKEFLSNNNLTLQAVAATQFVFTGWSGTWCSGTASCTFSPNGPETVTASFDCADPTRYGATCASVCQGNGNCSGNGTCSNGITGTGACTCTVGYFGPGCELAPDTDSDGDGILDIPEGLADGDGDGRANYLDLDSDNDGVLDSQESVSDPDSDGRGNYIDIDTDGDGIRDVIERATSEEFVAASGGDTNNDGIDNAFTSFPIVDTDGDGSPDYLDLDSDGDGTSDTSEAFDLNGDGSPDVGASGADSNSDGLDDAFAAYLTPTALNSKWRQLPSGTSPGAGECALLDLSKKRAAVSRARALLVQRTQKFANRSLRCGTSAANNLKQARALSKGILAQLGSTYGARLYQCTGTSSQCTGEDVTQQRNRLESLAKKLGRAQLAAMKKAIRSCPSRRSTKAVVAQSKDSADYLNDLIKAIQALPKNVTRCP